MIKVIDAGLVIGPLHVLYASEHSPIAVAVDNMRYPILPARL
jgi:hypothetical protein